MSKQLVEFTNRSVVPINSLQEYSPKFNNAQIMFKIPVNPNQLLDMNMRLVARIRYIAGRSTATLPCRVDNGNLLGTTGRSAGGGNPRDGLLNPATTENPVVGAECLFSNIQYTDAQNSILEHVQNPGRLAATEFSGSLSLDDYCTFAQMQYGAFGNPHAQTRSLTASDQHLSLKLYSGLSHSKPIPGALLKGELNITITLNSSNAVLVGGNSSTDAAPQVTNGASADGGASFQLLGCKLVYRTIEMDKQVPVKQNFNYRHFSLQTATIQASDVNTGLQLNASNVLTVATNFIPSSYLNTYDFDSFRSYKLRNVVGGLVQNDGVDINETDFLKNNLLFPIKQSVDETEFNNRADGKESYDAYRSRLYVNAIRPFYKLNHTLISPATENLKGGFDYRKLGVVGEYANGYDETPTNNKQVFLKDQPVYGLGCRYDELSTFAGSGYAQGQTFGTRIKSELNGVSPQELFTYSQSIRQMMNTPSGVVIRN